MSSWTDIFVGQPPQGVLCYFRRLGVSTPYVGTLTYSTLLCALTCQITTAAGFGDATANGTFLPNGTLYNGWPVYANGNGCILYRYATSGPPAIESAATPTTGTVFSKGGLTNYNSWVTQAGGTAPAGTCPISFLTIPSYLIDRWRAFP